MADQKIPETCYDIIIIGGGPAGFTAGLYAARADLRVLLIEGASTVSQITNTNEIENYPGIPEALSGFELVERFRKQAAQFGLKTISADVKGIEKADQQGLSGWRVLTGEKTYETLAMIIATGAHWRKLDVPGEAAFTGRGVSYCATCDGPFYR
jgi:thioredoxin reductase (NADPH)